MTQSRRDAVAGALAVCRANTDALDRLAALAAVVMDAPVGLVTLVDIESHLVGVHGLAEPYRSSRLGPAEAKLCRTVAGTGKPLAVENLGEDAEFAADPARVQFGAAAYSGVPICDEDGHAIGSLCVFDSRPRRWRQADRRSLEALGLAVESEIALHRDNDSRARLLRAFDQASPAIALVRGPDHVVEYVNPAYVTLFGPLSVGQPAAATAPVELHAFLPVMDQVLATGQTYAASDIPARMCWPGEDEPRERFFDFSYTAIVGEPGEAGSEQVDRHGILAVIVEATAHVHAQAELARRARRQEFLARAMAALTRRLDPAAELQALARVVIPELADVSTVHVLAEPVPPGAEPPLPVFTDRVAAAVVDGVESPPLSTGLRWDGDGDPITATIRAGALLRHPIPTPDVPPWSGPTGSAATFRSGLNAVVLAPVIVDGLVVAVASFGMCDDRPLWSEDDLDTLAEVARFAGIALGHGLSYQRTRQSALVLQRSLLTAPPQIPGLQICARYEPAGRDEVGGDWYDLFPSGEGRLTLAVGDVVGHDITAAAAMGQLRASVRVLSLDSDGPADVLTRLAAANAQLGMTPLATLVTGTLQRCGELWSFTYANAGHPPPVLLHPDGRTSLLDLPRGTALVGAYPGPWQEGRIELPPGATLLLYTDGLIERRGVDIDASIAALQARCTDHGSGSIDALCDALLAAAPSTDDIAVLAVRVES